MLLLLPAIDGVKHETSVSEDIEYHYADLGLTRHELQGRLPA
jgi:hypothetical protein